ncbi:hypothetical protein T08_16506, partial [Trichinella sp. T8]
LATCRVSYFRYSKTFAFRFTFLFLRDEQHSYKLDQLEFDLKLQDIRVSRKQSFFV